MNKYTFNPKKKKNPKMRRKMQGGIRKLIRRRKLQK